MPPVGRVTAGSPTNGAATLQSLGVQLDRVKAALYGDVATASTPQLLVRRTSSYTIPHSTDVTVPWQTFDVDDDEMWDPAAPDRCTIRTGGVWLFRAQLRYAANGTASRACKIMADGTDVFTRSFAAGKEPGVADGEGPTIGMTGRLTRFPKGTPIFVNVWQNSGASMTLPVDFGGIYLSGTWLAP